MYEALAGTPSTDDPADAAALARDQARAEAQAQTAEHTDLRLTRRNGRLRALLDLDPIGEATLHAWLRGADRPHPGTDGFTDTRPLAERRGDALIDLLARAAATHPTPHDPDGDDPDGDDVDGDGAVLFGDDDADLELPSGQSDPLGAVSPVALLTVTTTLHELRARLTGTGRLDTDATLSAAALRQLACDALVVPAVLAGATQVLDLGRSTRTWNRAQRRAVALRDRGCVAPGCDQPPAACQIHHCWHWIDGGPTDLHNPVHH